MEIIEKGYDAVAEHYFRELLNLKKITEELIESFIDEYKKFLGC